MDKFYEELDCAIKKLPTNEHLYLLGDFNARIGSDHAAWSSCIGHFGVGILNDNGQRLLELCSLHDMCISNTFFATKPWHRVSWRHPKSRHWHLIITHRQSLNCVLLTRTYHSADCDTDHSMVASKVRLQPKQIHRSKTKRRPCLNTTNTSNSELCNRFTILVTGALNNCPTYSAAERWDHIREATYTCAFETFGKRERTSPDWFEAGRDEIAPAVNSKRSALLVYKRDPCEKKLTALREARSNTQRIARQCANRYCQDLCQNIQQAADSGNIRAMYERMKKAFDPNIVKTAPLKSTSGEIITDRAKQMERWAEHYHELYSRETTVTDRAIDNTPSLPVMEELETPPTVERSNAIDSLANNKAQGKDGI